MPRSRMPVRTSRKRSLIAKPAPLRLTLKQLDLTDCDKITDQGLARIARLPNLEELNLYACDKISKQGLEHLAGLEHLKTLNLTDTGFGDDGAESLAKFLSLRRLELGMADITDAALLHLAKIKTLGYLDIYWCDQLTYTAVERLRKALPGCEVNGAPEAPQAQPEDE